MKNAHLRTAAVELRIATEHTATRVRAFSDRFAIDGDNQAHMLSIFGGDSEIAAMAGAIATGLSVTITLPDGGTRQIYMGEKTVTYRSHLRAPGSARPVRHLLAFSKDVASNGQLGQVYLLEDNPALIWAATTSFLGVPATPAWAVPGVEWLRRKEKIENLDGFNCSPIRISVQREELLEWVGRGVKRGRLHFPESNGPILWPDYTLDNNFRAQDAAAAAA